LAIVKRREDFYARGKPYNTVEQHLEPKGDIYSLIKVLRRGESVKSENVPGLEIEIDKILN
jgi:hypothetical protein